MKTMNDRIKVCSVVNDIGIMFNIELDNSPQPDNEYAIDEPRVIVKDARFTKHPGWENGQPISTYYLSTFMRPANGLCLDGGIPDWYLDDDAMLEAQLMIKGVWPYEIAE